MCRRLLIVRDSGGVRRGGAMKSGHKWGVGGVEKSREVSGDESIGKGPLGIEEVGKECKVDAELG